MTFIHLLHPEIPKIKEVNINDNNISGVLNKDPREFLNYINNSVDVLSFQLKVPTLEQIFLEEVGDNR